MAGKGFVKAARQGACLLLLGLWAVLLAGCGAEDENAALSPRVIADINKPGVVLITNIYTAQISVQDCQISPEGNQRLLQTLSKRLKAGEIADKQQLISAYFDELIRQPSLYLVPSAKVISQEAKSGCMGTGFILTEDGCIVTNAHVVHLTDEQLQQSMVQSALQKLVKNNLLGFQQQLSASGYSLSEDQLSKLEQVIVNFYASHLKVSNVQQQLYASLGMGKVQDGFACTVKKIGEPTPGKDIAVLQAVDRKGLPTVELGDDTVMHAGDKVFVLGYPGVATFNDALSQDGKLESTFTAGMLSARKMMADNWEIFQMDAAITNGNSGGPVFNEQGKVIGVATFGSLNEQGNQIQGMNFAIPVSIVREFLPENGSQLQIGEAMEQYREAVRTFDQGEYEDALSEFQEIHQAQPGFPYIQEFIQQAQASLDKQK